MYTCTPIYPKAGRCATGEVCGRRICKGVPCWGLAPGGRRGAAVAFSARLAGTLEGLPVAVTSGEPGTRGPAVNAGGIPSAMFCWCCSPLTHNWSAETNARGCFPPGYHSLQQGQPRSTGVCASLWDSAGKGIRGGLGSDGHWGGITAVASVPPVPNRVAVQSGCRTGHAATDLIIRNVRVRRYTIIGEYSRLVCSGLRTRTIACYCRPSVLSRSTTLPGISTSTWGCSDGRAVGAMRWSMRDTAQGAAPKL